MTILFLSGIFYWKSYHGYVLKGYCVDLAVMVFKSEIKRQFG